MTINLSPTFDSDHPANVLLDPSWGSAVHVLYGYLMGQVRPVYSLAMLAFFIGYQVSQTQSGESWSSTGGEFIELGAGLSIAAIRNGGNFK